MCLHVETPIYDSLLRSFIIVGGAVFNFLDDNILNIRLSVIKVIVVFKLKKIAAGGDSWSL